MISIGKVGIVFANNGNIYLSNFRRNETTNLKDAVVVHEKYSVEELKEIALVGNILKVLGFEGLEISELLIKELLEWARNHHMDATNLLMEEGELKEELLSLVR